MPKGLGPHCIDLCIVKKLIILVKFVEKKLEVLKSMSIMKMVGVGGGGLLILLRFAD